MSDVISTDGEQSSAVAQVQEKVSEVAGDAQEKAGELSGQAADRLRERINTRSTELGEQVGALSDGMRRTGHLLRSEGKDDAARLADPIVERSQQLGRYLVDLDADALLHQVESFGRRRPWVAAAGGVVAGFGASRFLRASSRRRSAATGHGAQAWPLREPLPSAASSDDDTASLPVARDTAAGLD